MVAIPFFKLFSLTIKTVSKPMATRIKAGEISSDFDPSKIDDVTLLGTQTLHRWLAGVMVQLKVLRT